MQFPMEFNDLSLWLAITSIILLTASELLMSKYDQIHFIIEKKHLKTTALILGFLFLFTVAIRIFQMIIAP